MNDQCETPHTDLCRRLCQHVARGGAVIPPPELQIEAAAALKRQAKEIAELRAFFRDAVTLIDWCCPNSERKPLYARHAAVIARVQEEGE